MPRESVFNEDAAAWCVVQVKAASRPVTGAKYPDPARAPFLVEHLLRLKGFDTFAPRRTVYRFANKAQARRRVKREVARPIFPGWLFVRAAGSIGYWRELLETPGVVAIAGIDGRPALIGEHVIRQLARRFGDGFVSADERERYMRSRREYAAGQTVRFAEAAFEGCTGQVISVKGRMARVLLNFLGATREIDVDSMLLEAA